MRNSGFGVTIVLVALMTVGLGGCKRSGGTASAQAVTGAIAPPVPQKQPASAAQAFRSPPSSSSSATPSASAPAASDDSAPRELVAVDSSQSFTIGDHTFRMLKHVERIEATPAKSAEETVEWWELRNSKDQVVYREQYPFNLINGAFDFSVSVTASSFTTKEGAGIVVQRGDEPSDPLSGGSVQVFGYKYGREKYGVDESLFGSFGPPIWVQGEYLGIGTDTSYTKPTLPPGVTMMTMDDILKFKVWTGNFFILYPVRINWITGRLEPARRCLEMTGKARSESCPYPVEVESHLGREQTFVRLFPEANEGFTPKHVVVQAETKIEFLEARAQIDWAGDGKAINFDVNGDVWLKVRIGGEEGWIHSEEDFEALGVPQAG
jgi:hypothetical protein